MNSQVHTAININNRKNIFIYYGRETNPQVSQVTHTPTQKRILIHPNQNSSKIFHTPIKKTLLNTKQKTNNKENNHGREKEDNNYGREDSHME